MGRRGLLILGLASVSMLSLAFWSRLLGRRRLRFPYLARPLGDSAYAALASRPGWKASRIQVAPGIGLNGLVRRPQAADAPWVLFYPGNDADMLKGGQEFLARLAADRDWGLAVFAYRGYDSSDGTARLRELAADAPAILEQLCAGEDLPRSRVHVTGFSIGGHQAVRAMAVAGRLQPRPASLALLAPVDDIVMVPRSFLQRLDRGDDYQTRPFLAGIPAPVLVVQGSADEALLGPAQGQAIASALGDKARYVELAGVGHSALLANEVALATVREFISSNPVPPAA